MNDRERTLLNLLQHDFPLEKQPYESIASRLGITPEACIDMIASLRDRGVLREIRPVINWKKAGYSGVLLGLTVDPSMVDTVAASINTLPGVTHNYLRDGAINLWCTLTSSSDQERRQHIIFMRALPGVRDLKEFHSEKTYKIGLVLDV